MKNSLNYFNSRLEMAGIRVPELGEGAVKMTQLKEKREKKVANIPSFLHSPFPLAMCRQKYCLLSLLSLKSALHLWQLSLATSANAIDPPAGMRRMVT